jgi:hypothetical protein
MKVCCALIETAGTVSRARWSRIRKWRGVNVGSLTRGCSETMRKRWSSWGTKGEGIQMCHPHTAEFRVSSHVIRTSLLHFVASVAATTWGSSNHQVYPYPG